MPTSDRSTGDRDDGAGRRPTRRTGLLILAVGTGVSVLGLVVALLLGGVTTGPGRVPAAVSPPSNLAGQPPAARVREPAPALPPERFQRALDDYRAMAIYPPWSRAHDDGTAYKLRWNEPVAEPLPAMGGPDLVIRFAADRAHVTHGEQLTSWIEVHQKEDPARRVPFDVAGAWVMTLSGGNRGRAAELTYNDRGVQGDEQRGDHRFTNRFDPAELETLSEPREVRIMALVVIDGVENTVYRDFTYAPEPVLDVVTVSDRIEDGSLVVTLEVDVHTAGLITFEANAYGSDDTALGYVDQSVELAEGRQTVELTFFGRIFRDLDARPPFVVKDLRGFLHGPGGVPVYWSDGREHVTARYDLAQLSPDEWQSEEKAERIRRLEALAAGQADIDPTAPRHIRVERDGSHTIVE